MVELISQLSLLLPTRNEGQNIVEQVNEVFRAFPHIGEIIVSDDASSDGTIGFLKKVFPVEISQEKLRLHQRNENPGLGPSLKEAIALARQPFIAWMDADLSMPAEKLPEMLGFVASGYDVCVGTRFAFNGKQKKFWNSRRDFRFGVVLSTVLNKFARMTLGIPATDFTSGFVVAKASLLKELVFRGTHGEYFMFFLDEAHSRGAVITEVGYEIKNRERGTSKTFGGLKTTLVNCRRYAAALWLLLRSRTPLVFAR